MKDECNERYFDKVERDSIDIYRSMLFLIYIVDYFTVENFEFYVVVCLSCAISAVLILVSLTDSNGRIVPFRRSSLLFGFQLTILYT